MGLFLIRRVTGLFPFGSHMDRMLTKRIMSGEFTKNGSLNHLSRSGSHEAIFGGRGIEASLVCKW